MSTAALYLRFRRFLSPHGLWRALRELPGRILAPREMHPFDRLHRVDTGGLIYADRLDSGHKHDRYSAGYYATAPSLFHGAIELWAGTLAGSGYTLDDYTLVDIGCGKGRVVMMASDYQFREVVGVELNPRLAAVARKNLRRWLRRPQARGKAQRTNMQIAEADALTWPLPDGPVVLFFFNSFEQEMARMWLDRLGAVAAERTAPIDLIYVHPEFDDLVRQVPGVQQVADELVPFSPEDAAADAFEVAVDRCAVYRWDKNATIFGQSSAAASRHRDIGRGCTP